jgi:hypothetical protein
MKTATVTLSSVSAYSQGRAHKDEKKSKETHKDHEERTWRGRLHVNKDGKVFMPPMSFKNCLSEAAKYLAIQVPGKGKTTYTKHFEAGVLVTDPLVLDINKDDVEGEWLHVPSDGKRGGDKRVWKCFPVIHEWEGQVVFHILDDTVTKDIFEQVLKEAGQFIGLGRFRPRRNGYYGRFEIKAIKWS